MKVARYSNGLPLALDSRTTESTHNEINEGHSLHPARRTSRSTDGSVEENQPISLLLFFLDFFLFLSYFCNQGAELVPVLLYVVGIVVALDLFKYAVDTF